MGAKIVTILHNTSETDALDAHFIAQREAELATAKGAARGEFARKIGVASLLGCAGLGLALFGASFFVAGPRFSVRDVVVDHIVQRDRPFDNYVPVDKPFYNYAPPALAPRSSAEKTFEGSKEWGNADVRGRILRPDGNGFVMMTETGAQSFFSRRDSALTASP
jgi:hypothetical protein